MRLRPGVLIATLSGALACASNNAVVATNTAIEIRPASADLEPGGIQVFMAYSGSQQITGVEWGVVETNGGTVANGTYTAPNGAGTFHLTATSVANRNVKATAEVTVTTAALTISPRATGTVVGATIHFTVRPPIPVNWSIDQPAGCGSIAADGTYTAPSSPVTCNITATAQSSGLQAHAVVLVFSTVAGTWVNITPPDVWAVMSPTADYCTLGVSLSPVAPSTIYLGTGCTPRFGVWKTTDGGGTWSHANAGANYYNNDGSPFVGGEVLDTSHQWTVSVDPTDPNTVYVPAGFGSVSQGLWKTTDAGHDWKQLLSDDVIHSTSADIYALAINPRDHLQLLVSFHSGWNFGPDAGIIESKDGGNTWILHPPAGSWGTGHYAFFLGRDDAGNNSSNYWLLATQGAGYWRTTDAGNTWTQVTSTFKMQHGAGGLYRATNGVLYCGATNHLARSTDNGRTWSDSGAPSNQDGYNSVIGDGTYIYVQTANTSHNTTGVQPYYYSLETDGLTWRQYNTQTFNDGPGWMAFDATNKIVYSSNWGAGLWRLVTGH